MKRFHIDITHNCIMFRAMRRDHIVFTGRKENMEKESAFHPTKCLIPFVSSAHGAFCKGGIVPVSAFGEKYHRRKTLTAVTDVSTRCF